MDLTPLAINVNTAFTVGNCLEHELLEGFWSRDDSSHLKYSPSFQTSQTQSDIFQIGEKNHSTTVRHVFLPRWQGWRAQQPGHDNVIFTAQRRSGRNLGEHRLVRRSGTMSRGTVDLVFCWRMHIGSTKYNTPLMSFSGASFFNNCIRISLCC